MIHDDRVNRTGVAYTVYAPVRRFDDFKNELFVQFAYFELFVLFAVRIIRTKFLSGTSPKTLKETNGIRVSSA